MKILIAIALFIPALAFGQVKIDELTKRNGLAYEQGTTLPFTGKAYRYFPNGKVETILEYKAGLPGGVILSWYTTGSKQIEGLVESGQRTGTWNLYYENGKLKKQATYANNLENGEETFWFENGNIEKKGTYFKGVLEGKYEWFYENGMKKQEGYFINGKEDGTWNEWYEDGAKKMTGNFKNYAKHGNWTWWNEDGSIKTSKNYINGLVEIDNETMDSYIEKMEFYLSKRNFKETVKNIELADRFITDRTEKNPVYMTMKVFHSKAYALFSHYRQAEEILLEGLSLTDSQTKIILLSHKENSPAKIRSVINEILKKNKSKATAGNHILLSLCYNILEDSIRVQQHQQLAMMKGDTSDWVIRYSLALYELAGERANNYNELQEVEKEIKINGINEEREFKKAQYLLRTERFEEAQNIVDKYLQSDNTNVSALLLKADIEMAYGNVTEMEKYENLALAIDPNAFKRRR